MTLQAQRENDGRIDWIKITVSDINGNTFPNTYDALGRVIFVGATVKL